MVRLLAKVSSFDFSAIARQTPRLFAKADFVEELGASLFNLVRGMMAAAPPRHGIEQGDSYIVGESETGERPRQLETSRQSEMGALMRLEAVEFLAGEMHCALFVAQRT